jgi:hypothetical protein
MSEPNSDIKRPVIDPVTGLLPCPFCGGKANSGWQNSYGEFVVLCFECEASTTGATHQDAKDFWNRRTP